MVKLLDEVLTQVRELPDIEQERIALLIMRELSPSPVNSEGGILKKLKQIKIQGPEDFAQNIDVYLNGTK
jgi:hypothetical protein